MLTRFVLLIILCIPFAGKTQNVSSVHACELLGACTADGYAAHIGYINYISERLLARLDFFYGKEKKTTLETLHHQAYGVDLYAGYTVKYFRSIETYVNVLGGLTASAEQGNFTGSPVEFKGIKYGGMAGLEAEKYLNVNFSVITCFNQRFMHNPNDQWGSLRWYAQIGIRFHIASLKREE